MNELKIFEKKEFGQIRMIELEGVIWFVAKDIADILKYSETNAMTKRLDSEDFISAKLSGMNMNSTLINESGLYAAILGCSLPEAKCFKHWVTSEVLPSIRKHSMYATDELLANPDLLIQVATALKEEREARKLAETQREQLQQELDYSKEWYSIKRVAALNGVMWQMFDWRKLKKASKQLGYGIKKIFDANYGEVNTYHRKAWEEVYPEYEL